MQRLKDLVAREGYTLIIDDAAPDHPDALGTPQRDELCAQACKGNIIRMRSGIAPEDAWAHVAVGKMDGHVIMRTTHEAPTTALRLAKGCTAYTGMVVQMELARRGPPGGWRWREQHSDPRVVGWVCYDAAEGWRPLLAP